MRRFDVNHDVDDLGEFRHQSVLHDMGERVRFTQGRTWVDPEVQVDEHAVWPPRSR